jgi:hypothetical protein
MCSSRPTKWQNLMNVYSDIKPSQHPIVYFTAAALVSIALVIFLYQCPRLADFIEKSVSSTDNTDLPHKLNYNNNNFTQAAVTPSTVNTRPHSEGMGQFGDYFGGMLNPLFGLLSIVILTITLRQQATRNQKQDFDNQFFSLLSLYDSVLNSIDKHERNNQNETQHWRGRDCFVYLHRKIHKRKSEIKTTSLNAAYEAFMCDQGWELGHYYRTVYHLFKHVMDGCTKNLISDEDSKKYYDLIRSQLSAHELALLKLSSEGSYRSKWLEITNSSEHADPFEHWTADLPISDTQPDAYSFADKSWYKYS